MAEEMMENDKAGTAPNPASPAALNSWKEIAGYLKIDVRTCQRWEQSLGLPVHRIGNSLRSRVVAYPAEIEKWRNNTVQIRDRQGNGEPARNGNGLRAAVNGNNARRKIKAKYLAVFLVPILAVTAAFLLEPYFDRNPADFRIKGSVLTVLNERGRKLWAFDTKLPRLKDDSFYRKAFPEKIRHIDEEGQYITTFPNIFIRDIDRDGRNEVLFNPQTTDELSAGKLFLFDGRGKERWIFDMNQEIQVGDQKYPPDVVLDRLDLKDVTGDGRPEILLAAHCYNRAPTRIALLDVEKNVLGEYWNYGQIRDFEVTNNKGNGQPEVILVGTNNEYGQACLIVLDPANMKGTSPQTPVRQFLGMREGTAGYYLRFPMTPVDRLVQPRGIFVMVQIMGNAHIVAVTRGQFIWYDFDGEMNLSQVTITDRYADAFEDAVRKGLLAPPLDREALKKELAAGVLYYDGVSKTWVNRRAMASPPELR